MNIDLKGKNALVCGASRGIGEASAVELASLGCNVILVARSASLLKTALANLPTAAGQSHSYICADFSLGEVALKEKLKHLLTNQNIHILINNTGGPAGGSLENATRQDFENALNNHLFISHALVGWLKAGMLKAGYGRIINIISTSVRQPINGLSVSNVIRGAMASWAKTLSNELAESQITVNNILPGTTKTERLDELISAKQAVLGLTRAAVERQLIEEIPLGRFAEAEEIAQVVAFLASPAAAYITGINLPVDGGKIKSI